MRMCSVHKKIYCLNKLEYQNRDTESSVGYYEMKYETLDNVGKLFLKEGHKIFRIWRADQFFFAT